MGGGHFLMTSNCELSLTISNRTSDIAKKGSHKVGTYGVKTPNYSPRQAYIPVVLWGLNTLINKMVGKPDTTRLSISCSNAQPLNNNCGRVNKKAVDLRTSARPPSFQHLMTISMIPRIDRLKINIVLDHMISKYTKKNEWETLGNLSNVS